MRKFLIVFLVFSIGSFVGFAQEEDTHNPHKSITKKQVVGLLNNINPNASEEEKKYNEAIAEKILKIAEEQYNIITHKIKPKETWYGLSKHYGITIPNLKKANPIIAKEGLKIGFVLKIPKKTINEYLKNKDTILHLIKPKETWYSISKKYDVKINILKAFNPTAVKEFLKSDTTIKIPVSKQKPLTNIQKNNIIMARLKKELDRRKNIYESNKADSLWVSLDYWSKKQPHQKEAIMYKPLNIDLLLPFKRYENKNLSAYNLFRNPKKLSNIVLDFYMGACFAIDSLHKKGVDIRYRIFDTANHPDTIAKIFQENDFSKSNAIIGPLYSENIEKVVAMSNGTVPIVYPLYSKKQRFFKGGAIIKTAPDIYYYERAITNYILKNLKGRKIILIGDKTLSSREHNLKLKNFFKRNNTNAEVEILNAKGNYLDAGLFNATIDTIYNRSQWILMGTENPVITSDVVNNIRGIYKQSNNIRLFSFRKGKNFDKIDDKMLAKLSFTYATNEIQNNSAFSKTQKIRMAFYKKFKGYPGQYALKGFDVVYDIAIRMLLFDREKHSRRFSEGYNFDKIIAGGITTKRISHHFKYTKNHFETIENQCVYLVRYDSNLNLEIHETNSF